MAEHDLNDHPRHDADQPTNDNPQDRPHSIDMSLALERQLEDEIPITPPISPTMKERPVSLDPNVLTVIVGNLRQALVEMTKERDDMVELLSETHAREAELKEALDMVSERCQSLESEMEDLKKKSQADDESISMLRTKVEESRRGLMRLQTESRRMSQMTFVSVDSGRNGPPSSFVLGSPSAGKRSSFAPLTGSGATRVHAHRRVSSVSEPSLLVDDNRSEINYIAVSPGAQQTSFGDDFDRMPSSSARLSGIFPRSASPSGNPFFAELEAMRRERDAALSEAEQARHEAAEANEAREASELCANALRTFISENAIGEGHSPSTALKLPPLPSQDTKNSESEAKKPLASSGWSLRLWKVDTSAPAANASSAESTGRKNSSATPVAETQAQETSPQSATPTAIPLTKKIGEFFSSRSSMSSGAPSTHMRFNHQEPTLNGSDSSSIDESEPISPDTSASLGNIAVRDSLHVSPSTLSTNLGAFPDTKADNNTDATVNTTQAIAV